MAEKFFRSLGKPSGECELKYTPMTKSRVIVLILTTLAIGSIAALIGWSASMKRVFGEEAYDLFLQLTGDIHRA